MANDLCGECDMLMVRREEDALAEAQLNAFGEPRVVLFLEGANADEGCSVCFKQMRTFPFAGCHNIQRQRSEGFSQL